LKANEFVKKFGIKEAKKVLHCMDDASEFKIYMPGDTWDKPTLIDAVGLRRLVESHELVEYMGGIDKAKEQAYVLAMEVDGFNPAKIEKAITDVESCMEVPSEPN